MAERRKAASPRHQHAPEQQQTTARTTTAHHHHQPQQQEHQQALSPAAEDYVSALTAYDAATAEAAQRFEVFADADARFKESQDTLHALLVDIDEEWETALSSVRGSKVNVKANSSVAENADRILRLLAKQATTIEDLDKAAGRVARGFARLAEAGKKLATDSKDARTSLEARLAEMTAGRVGVVDPKRPTSSSSSSH